VNLYVHFPFCRRKCSYCALYSRTGVSESERGAYVANLCTAVRGLTALPTTIYFGGGSPALCDLRPLSAVLRPLSSNAEFTVELHPLDVTEDKLKELEDLGVNRISMGVQSLDDKTLENMGRGYTALQAARAFELIKKHFDNAGIDLIVGYPGECLDNVESLGSWGLKHCSVYALQNERGLKGVPSDEVVMDRLREAGEALKALDLERYEISNYAEPGYECRHNFAVWRGEDYIGLGEGASGRVGLTRTRHFGTYRATSETVTPRADEIERTIFRLRTREGLDASAHPEWEKPLVRFVDEGLLTRRGATYFLTPRGAEVCDTVLAELV